MKESTLTAQHIFEAILVYALCHGSWIAITAMFGSAGRLAKKQRAHIIHRHVKEGHGDPLKHCAHNDCQTLSSVR